MQWYVCTCKDKSTKRIFHIHKYLGIIILNVYVRLESYGGGLKQPNDKCNAYFVAVVVYFSYRCTLHICTYAYSIVIKYNTLYMVYFKEKAARTLHKRYEKIPVNFIQTMSCAPSALFFFVRFISGILGVLWGGYTITMSHKHVNKFYLEMDLPLGLFCCYAWSWDIYVFCLLSNCLHLNLGIYICIPFRWMGQ